MLVYIIRQSVPWADNILKLFECGFCIAV